MRAQSYRTLTALSHVKAIHHGGKSAAAPGVTSHATRPASGVLLGTVLVAQLMVILDITAVNIAMPSIASDLQLSGSGISWTITSYSLIFGSLLLFGGRAADLLGRRRMFVTGLAVFAASSLASATAGTADALFAARAGQGLGAALLSPAALAIIMTAFQGSRRAKALAAWGAVGGAGAAAGVLVGGVLTELSDWRMIFYVNLPVAAALAVAVLKVIPADTRKPRWRGLDLRGAVLATASLGAIVFAITQAAGAGWDSPGTLLVGIGGLAGLAAFAACERRTDTPLLRIERLGDRAVGGGLLLMLPAAGLLFGLFLLSSLYLQGVLGMGPLATGLAFIPLAVSAGIGAHAAGHIVSHRGVRGPLAAAFAVTGGGMALLAHVGRNGSYLTDVLPGMLIAGAGLGVATVTVSISILAGARKEETGMISGLNSTGHEIGGTIGIAVFSTIAASGGVLAGPHAAAGIADAFVAASVLAAIACVVALATLPRSRQFLPKLRLNPTAMPIH
jgi:EmrB/QacA subfamily drug resistance transporter